MPAQAAKSEVKPRRIVAFYNGDHAPYQVHIWPGTFKHILWLFGYIGKQVAEGGGVWEVKFERENGKFTLLLDQDTVKPDPANNTNQFLHRLHTAAQADGIDTIRTGRLHELGQMLREEGIGVR